MRGSIVLTAIAVLTVSAAAQTAFDKAKFDALKPHVTTKDDVVAAVGKPTYEMSEGLVYLYQFWGAPDDNGKKPTIIVTIIFGKDGTVSKVTYYSNFGAPPASTP